MIKIDFSNKDEIFDKFARAIFGQKLTQTQKLLKLLEMGYGISCIFASEYPLSIGGYLSGPIRDLRKQGKKIGTFRAKGEKSQTYFLEWHDEQLPLLSKQYKTAS